MQRVVSRSRPRKLVLRGPAGPSSRTLSVDGDSVRSGSDNDVALPSGACAATHLLPPRPSVSNPINVAAKVLARRESFSAFGSIATGTNPSINAESLSSYPSQNERSPSLSPGSLRALQLFLEVTKDRLGLDEEKQGELIQEFRDRYAASASSSPRAPQNDPTHPVSTPRSGRGSISPFEPVGDDLDRYSSGDAAPAHRAADDADSDNLSVDSDEQPLAQLLEPKPLSLASRFALWRNTGTVDDTESNSVLPRAAAVTIVSVAGPDCVTAAAESNRSQSLSPSSSLLSAAPHSLLTAHFRKSPQTYQGDAPIAAAADEDDAFTQSGLPSASKLDASVVSSLPSPSPSPAADPRSPAAAHSVSERPVSSSGYEKVPTSDIPPAVCHGRGTTALLETPRSVADSFEEADKPSWFQRHPVVTTVLGGVCLAACAGGVALLAAVTWPVAVGLGAVGLIVGLIGGACWFARSRIRQALVAAVA